MAKVEKDSALKKLFTKWKKNTPKNLDSCFHELHDNFFEKFDCLSCANCCKSISPIITDKDIERMSKYMKIKPSVFAEKYIFMDTDDFWAFKQTPCPFLGADNYCSIYDARPKACLEYPHTDRRNMKQILDITYNNYEVCPAVTSICNDLVSKFTI